MNVPNSKIGALQIAPKKQNDDFVENESNDFD
jgi:hypothetical protein